MTRAPCCEKAEVRKGPWTPEEDELLVKYVREFGEGNWSTVPKKAGLVRCGKSCRLRWANYLRPDLKRGTFTEDEERLIISLHQSLGNRWAKIATELPGRTDNDIKNHWNTRMKKRLREEGIDPDTHLPLSQIQNDEDKKDKTPHKRGTPGPPPEKDSSSKKQKVSESPLKLPLLGQFGSVDLSRVVCDEKLMLCWPTEDDMDSALAPLSTRSEHSDAESGVESGAAIALKAEAEVTKGAAGMIKNREESLGVSQESEPSAHDHPDSPTSVIREAVALLKSGVFGHIPPGGFLANALLEASASSTKPPRPRFIAPPLTIPPVPEPPPSAPSGTGAISMNGGVLMSPFLLKNLWGEGSDEYWTEADLEATALHLPSPHILPSNAGGLLNSASLADAKALMDLTSFDSLLPQSLLHAPREKLHHGVRGQGDGFGAVKVDCSTDFDALELFQNNSFSPICKVAPLSPWPESLSSPRNWPAIEAPPALKTEDRGNATEEGLPTNQPSSTSMPKQEAFATTFAE